MGGKCVCVVRAHTQRPSQTSDSTGLQNGEWRDRELRKSGMSFPALPVPEERRLSHGILSRPRLTRRQRERGG